MDQALILGPKGGRWANIPWPEYKTLALIALFKEGKMSMGLIAKELGLTRNSVIGKIHRLQRQGKLDKPIVMIKVRTVRTRTEPKSTEPKLKTEPRLRLVPNIYLVPQCRPKRIRLKIIEPQNVTFAELESQHCRWPLGDPKHSDFRFCGCTRVSKAPYCEGHVRLAGRVYEKRAA